MIEYRLVRGEKPAADEVGSLSGRAAPFNSQTTIGGDKWGFREVIKPGAFKKSIAERDIVLLDNHQSEKPLARTSAGTLSLNEKRDGLHFEAQPANTSYARDAVENARAGNFGGCSFGFEVIKDSWERGQNGEPDLRTLEEVRLHEISVVTFPAYADTHVKAREASIQAARESRERALGPIDAPEGTRDMDNDENRGPKPYGDVKYADPKNGKYPIDTKEHAKAAWSYINKASNAAKYPLNGVSLASVKAKIKAACKKFGIKISESNDELAFDAAELREIVAEASRNPELIDSAIRSILEYLDRAVGKLDLLPDPYEDDWYEGDDTDDSDDKDMDRSSRDSQDGDADGDKAKGQDQKSDASGADKGEAKNDCNTCDGKGTDKSGNKCAACGGSGHTNGDGGKHESGKGHEDTDGKSPSKQKTSGKSRDSEPGSPTRSDEDRKDALRRIKAATLRAKYGAASEPSEK